jgi:hypothetical protein
MLIDAQNLFSDAQAVTAAAISTNIIDQGVSGGRDIGTGEPLYIVSVCDVAMTDGSSDSTLTVSLYGDSTSTITPDASDTLFTFPATSAAGTTYIARLDPGMAALQYQYIAVYYTPNSGNLTTGSFTTFLTTDIQKYKSYAKGYTIS